METIIEPGEKVHIITRRIFETDLRRHFAGEVVSATSRIIRVRGYGFVYDEWNDQFSRLPEERLRLYSLISAGHIINILPQNIEIAELKYKITTEGKRIITNEQGYSLDVSEFGAKR